MMSPGAEPCWEPDPQGGRSTEPWLRGGAQPEVLFDLLLVLLYSVIRRNRIRSTEGLQTVPSLQKLYMSNNEIQVGP